MGKAARLNRERLIANKADFNQPYKTTFTVEEVLVECRRQHGVGYLLFVSDSIGAYVSEDSLTKAGFKISERLQKIHHDNYFVFGFESAVCLPVSIQERTKAIADFAKIVIIQAPFKTTIQTAVNREIDIPKGANLLRWCNFIYRKALSQYEKQHGLD